MMPAKPSLRPPALAAATLLSASLVSAQVPAGAELEVNTRPSAPVSSSSAAATPTGDFAVVWQTLFDGSSEGVSAQSFQASGMAAGAELQVNSHTTSVQWPGPGALAVDASGRFVSVWASSGQDGDGWGVFGRRFLRSGQPLGDEFQVNTFTTGDQGMYFIVDTAEVAVAPTGAFVVAWSSTDQDGSYLGVFAQRFGAAGERLGAELQVNTFTTFRQWQPAVAIAVNGDFVVVWQSAHDGSGYGIFGQRFGAAGNREGGEFLVNTSTLGAQMLPAVATVGADGFVVAWWGPDGNGAGIFAQRFDASGEKAGTEFRVNTYTTNNQYYPTVAGDRAGSFVVAWQSLGNDGDDYGIFARRFDATGTGRGGEFRVNTYTTGRQWHPSLAADPAGNFVISWESIPAGYGGIFAQRFGGLLPVALSVDTGGSGSDGNGVLEPGETVDVRPSWRNVNGAALTFSAALSAITGPAGGTYAITDGAGAYGTVADGATRACADCYAVAVGAPSGRPRLHWDASATEGIVPDALGQRQVWPLHVGESFVDVPRASGFYRFVETVLHEGVAGGCGGAQYCPSAPTTREQVAVLVLAAKEGAGWFPPSCTTPVFDDVPPTSPFCRWIEELARRGVVGGCSAGSYCPSDPVSREQMAVFLLRALDPALVPPACTVPMFPDVPASSPFCRWIEELARRGVVGGCGGGAYCPSDPVTREQMAVFVSRTFGLALYGP